MLLFLLDGKVISGTLSHNMIVQGILVRFIWVNSAQGHRNDALHDPRVKAALIIILYAVMYKSVPLCMYVRADPGWISLRVILTFSSHPTAVMLVSRSRTEANQACCTCQISGEKWAGFQ